MEVAALVIALAAFVFALVALSKASSVAARANDLERDARRRNETVSEELEQRLAAQRQLIAALARGEKLTPEMVEEGRLWRDASPQEGLAMVQQGDVHLLDVRTPQETAAGIIPGAQMIPIDELERRFREVPKGRRTLVYCAGGGRSAAACEFLSQQGYSELYNLAGGFTSWTGPSRRPA